MKIGLFFGSFNPIHTGHLIIANHVAAKVDKIWFIVSPQNPLKQPEKFLHETHRLYLAKLAIEDDSRFEVSDIEFRLAKPSFTINTLVVLSQQYPEHEFLIIIGSDNYENFSKWKSAEEIVQKYKLLVYERPWFPINRNWNYSAEILNAPLLGISSTHIRQLIRQGKSIRYLVPAKVYDAINLNGYYKG